MFREFALGRVQGRPGPRVGHAWADVSLVRSEADQASCSKRGFLSRLKRAIWSAFQECTGWSQTAWDPVPAHSLTAWVTWASQPPRASVSLFVRMR